MGNAGAPAGRESPGRHPIFRGGAALLPAVDSAPMTRPKSKAEALARSNGREFRHVYRQGPGAAKAARHLTRRQSNKAMRRHNRKLAEEV